MDTLKLIIATYFTFGLMISALSHEYITRCLSKKPTLRPAYIFIIHSFIIIGWLYFVVEEIVNTNRWKRKMKRKKEGKGLPL